MSTPVTEVPRSLENATVPPDSVPLPTPRMPTRHQEEKHGLLVTLWCQLHL